MRRRMLESKRARAMQVQVQEQAPYISRSEIHQSVYGMGKRSAETRPASYLPYMQQPLLHKQACSHTVPSAEICFRNNVYCNIFPLHPKKQHYKGLTIILKY